MTAPPSEPARARARAGRMSDLAWLAPIAGAFLLASPAAALFSGGSLLLWVFGVWAGLIAAAFLMSRRLVAEEERRDAAPPPAPGAERESLRE